MCLLYSLQLEGCGSSNVCRRQRQEDHYKFKQVSGQPVAPAEEETSLVGPGPQAAGLQMCSLAAKRGEPGSRVYAIS